MMYVIGGAAAFACLGLGAHFFAMAFEQFSDTRFTNRVARR